MILAEILQWFLLILGAFLTLNAHWLGAHALCPALVTRARTQYERRPVFVTLIGLLIAVPTLLVTVVLATKLPHPLVQAGAIGLGLVLVLLALVGSAGLVERIGLGLPAAHDATQPWRRLVRGGVVLGFAFLMPFLGWFVLLPWTLVSGLGAVALAGRAPRAVSDRTGIDSATVVTVITAPQT